MAEDVKNDEQQTEKPLDKMTVVELREAAKEEIPDIKGVTGMKKDELLAALKDARGIKDETPAKKKKKKKTAGPKKEMTVKEMKQEIVRLRAEKESIRKEGDKKKNEIIRRRINRLKKMTRKAA
ncbi:transcription termination factor Rho [Thermodesulfobacteriota bacterium]